MQYTTLLSNNNLASGLQGNTLRHVFTLNTKKILKIDKKCIIPEPRTNVRNVYQVSTHQSRDIYEKTNTETTHQ